MLKGAGGKLSDLVLIRASGQAIEAAGGIAEGMSGSPVYVDGRLLGAISYVLPEAITSWVWSRPSPTC